MGGHVVSEFLALSLSRPVSAGNAGPEGTPREIAGESGPSPARRLPERRPPGGRRLARRVAGARTSPGPAKASTPEMPAVSAPGEETCYRPPGSMGRIA